MHLYYEDAIDADQFKSEQSRIKREKGATTKAINAIGGTRDELAAKLDEALTMLANCDKLYKKSSYAGRRKLNAYMVEAFYVMDDNVESVQLTGLFATLSDHRLVPSIKSELEAMEKQSDEEFNDAFQQMLSETKNSGPLSLDRSSIVPGLVGPVGLEPTTERL